MGLDPQSPLTKKLAAGRQAAAEAADAAQVLSEQLANPRVPEIMERLPELSESLRRFAEAQQSLAAHLDGVLESAALFPSIEGEPTDVCLFRHGRSVGNERDKIHQSKDARIIEQYSSTPNSELRLVTKGRCQAEALGKWLKESGIDFDAAFVSDYVRAEETAGIAGCLMGLPKTWRISALFGERRWDRFDELSPEAQDEEYEQRDRDVRYWSPPNGESMKLMEVYVRLAMGTLHRKYCEKSILIASHGEFITAYRAVQERLDHESLVEAFKEGVPNCGVVHYSRRNPESGEIAEHLNWVRLVCPWDHQWKSGKWNGSWRRIERPEYSSEQLLDMAGRYPQIFDVK